jgi:lipopolysaccharide biosynthesis glycosyltransferase
MNIITIMDYRFDESQINELKLCLLWIKQAKLWLRPTDNVFIYTSKKLPKILIDEFLPNFKECISIGSPNLEPSCPKEFSEMIWYKLYILCHFPYDALFLDADAIIMNDISELEKIKLTNKHPIFMIDHETDIKTHTDKKPLTINSGVVLFKNLSQTKFSWKNLIEFGNRIGYIYRYKNSNEIIPGNDQALLQSYCEHIGYDYRHAIFDIRYNTCSKKISYIYKDSKKRIKCKSIDDLSKDVSINHYWGPFKPWKINCSIFMLNKGLKTKCN